MAIPTTDTPTAFLATLAGRYAIERELGRGGMATVYLARDTRQDELVAIKVLRPELAASIGAERFLREIALGSLLRHPHIVGVLDSGEAAGQLFYVMPYIEGESLRERIARERQLSVDDTIAIARQVADALDHAHAADVVHRDIKPENIMLSGERVWVTDFGIARAVTEAGGETLTKTGMAVGTPLYMSPEQALGSRDVTPRSDTYSFACVVYELLAGDPPFTGGNMMALLAKHTLEQVPSLSIVRPGIPPAVEEAIFIALAKTPADRFRTAGDFVRAMAGEIPLPRHTPTGGSARRTHPGGEPAVAAPPPRSMPRLAWAVGALCTALAVAGGAYWAHRRNGPATPGGSDAARVAVTYFADQSDGHTLRALADGLTEGLIDRLSAVPTLHVASRNAVAPLRGAATDSVARALEVGSVVTGALRRTETGVHLDVRLMDAGSNTEVGAEGFDVRDADVASLTDSVPERVAEFLRRQLGTRIQLDERRGGTADPQAWLALQRGERRRKDADSLAAFGDGAGALAALAAADSSLAVAEGLDARWAEAPALRAAAAAQRARMLRARGADAPVVLDSGLAAAERALAVNPRNAAALEARGTLRLLRSQQLATTDPRASERDLAQAENDLVAATTADPARASAWATLSQLYYRRQSVSQANLAAQNAYRADAYLTNADAVLTRLFWTSHDMESFQDARKWCAEGFRRFPARPFFTECQLWLTTTKLEAPDPARTWALFGKLKAVTPAARWTTDSLRAELIVGMALARDPALHDSARRVVERVRPAPELDPHREIAGMQAVAYVFLHDYDAAINDIETYLASNPEHARGFKTNTAWWWRDPGLQNHPRFRRLIAGIP